MPRAVVLYLRKLALAFWTGEMLFFAFIFAPKVFSVLPRPMAAELQNHIFGPYFMVGVVCGAIVFLSLLRPDNKNEWTRNFTLIRDFPRKRLAALALTFFAWAIFMYSYFVLMPQIQILQPYALADSLAAPSFEPEKAAAFKSLHRLSVGLNGAALLALLALLGLV